MSEGTILVVDDDPKMSDRASALAALESEPVCLVTLDLNLGVDNGYDIARQIGRDHGTPIIMVTGRGDVIDRVVGLELGADDYIVKPFHPREMVARVRTVLRRAGRKAEELPAAEGEVYEFDGMRAVPSQLELRDRDGNVVDMTAGDFRLLEVLLEAPGRALSRDTILDRMHGRSWSPYDRSIDNQIARLRKKIEVDPANPNIIKTVRGIGYTLAVPVRRV